MKAIFILFTSLITSINCYGQMVSKNDTIFHSPDSTVVFFQTFCDSSLIKSFYGSWTGKTDTIFSRGGFLWLRKDTVVIEYLSHKWDEKELSTKKCTIRRVVGEPMIIYGNDKAKKK